MDVEWLQHADPEYDDQVVHTRHVAEREPTTVPAADVLPDRLTRGLPHSTLYTHQADSLDALAAGENVCLTTSTSSGKTLVYALHIARQYLDGNTATALLVYPTKALARDQQATLQQLYRRLGLGISVGVYDGDVDRDDKDRIRDECDVIITNFVGLNVYLAHHASWTRFFSRLRTVVIDEAHTYTGVEGMHVAWVIRRLLRLVRSRLYAARPQLVLTTATIGNPADHTQALTGEDAVIIDRDGSAHGARDIVLWNPPTYGKNNVQRKSTHKEASRVFATLVAEGKQTLMFVPSRRLAEQCALWAREHLDEMDTTASVEPYHAGHTKTERRNIEETLKAGTLDGVISTSALEVGIDVGSVDATVLDGYPNSRMSFWQQLGRAGRGTQQSLTVLVLRNDSIDQYIANDPGYLFDEDVEDAVVNLDNDHVYEQHVITAAREKPLTTYDQYYFDDRLPDTVDQLLDDDTFTGSLDEQVIYAAGGRPEAAISMFGGGGETFDVTLTHDDGDTTSLPPVTPTRAFRELHPNAIYLHRGDQYEVTAFDRDTRRIELDAVDVEYSTQTQRTIDIEDIVARDSVTLDTGITVHRGVGTLRETYPTYARVYEDGSRKDGFSTQVDSTLEMRTHMCWFTLDNERWDALFDASATQPLGALHAAEHGIIELAPTELMLDSRDLGGLSIASHPETQRPTVFIYDGVDGGLGFSHAIYDELTPLARATAYLIEHCACTRPRGCPACVMSSSCGSGNDPLDTPGALHCLHALVNGQPVTLS
jgi:DEAD/DEAH box helicase domain-containing protein